MLLRWHAILVMSFEIGLQKCVKQSCLFWLDFGHIHYLDFHVLWHFCFDHLSSNFFFCLFIYFLVKKVWHYDIDENEQKHFESLTQFY